MKLTGNKKEDRQTGMKAVTDVTQALKQTNQFLDSVHARLELSNENENKIIKLLEGINKKLSK